MRYISTIDGREFDIEIDGRPSCPHWGRVIAVNFELVSGQPVYSLILDGKSFELFVYESDDEWQVLLRGRQYQVKVKDWV